MPSPALEPTPPAASRPHPAREAQRGGDDLNLALSGLLSAEINLERLLDRIEARP